MKAKELKSIIKRVILGILLCVILFSVAKIVTYFEEMAEANQLQNDIIEEVVTPADSQDKNVETSAPSDIAVEDEESATDEELADGETNSENAAASEDEETEENTSSAPAVSESTPSMSAVTSPSDSGGINVDFATLTARYPDVVAYIYGPGTKINYPIAYDPVTNDYYLNRDLDGNLNANGSIFVEHLNSPDFSDQNTILYGHHMKSGLMFAGLIKYKDPSYYSTHPYFYIYTPTQSYKLNLFAGFVCAHDDEVFATSLSQDQLQRMAANSTFRSNIGTPTGRLVTMCTCTYEFSNARYVIVGELEPIY